MTKPACTLKEWDETWDDLPVHIIDMGLPFDDPVVFFQVGSHRVLVPRHSENEMRWGPQHQELSMDVLLRNRMKSLHELVLKMERDGVPGWEKTAYLMVVTRCPSGVRYGLFSGPGNMTLDHMHITAPARMLFG
jgi:hypothetical protein